jgi:hypothetical protein
LSYFLHDLKKKKKKKKKTNHVPAMAQSIHDKQENFKAVASEITSKPEAELTQADASKLMSAEVGLPHYSPARKSSLLTTV